ncbi:hypothetical protein ABZ413_16540 [Nocardia rhamnosiphila]|uniref:hypothetical protein n=1 Tax=Nocardia rhamnosiphila TaxID=426716 RepID=UPI00340B3AEA
MDTIEAGGLHRHSVRSGEFGGRSRCSQAVVAASVALVTGVMWRSTRSRIRLCQSSS